LARLLDFISRFRKVTAVCHPNADPDCIGAAYALLAASESQAGGPLITILAPEGTNTASSKLIEYLGVRVVPTPPEATDLYLFLDMPSIDQVPALKVQMEKAGTPYALIDHHVPDEKTLKNASFSIVKARSSTCEIVFEALGSRRSSLDRKALDALLAGIIYDSRRFLILPETALGTAARLVRLGSSPSKVLQLLTSEQDISERIAKLKGASRLRLFRSSGAPGDWVVALSGIGSYEASVARALTDLGADVAVVVSADGRSVRVSARSTDAISKKTGLNLARDVMKMLAESFSGQGGGHPTAASVNVKGDAQEIESRALALIAEKTGPLREIPTKK